MDKNQEKTMRIEPLNQKRGLDVDTKKRLDNISTRSFGDTENGRELYESIGESKPPKKILTEKGFPWIMFVIMFIIDIVDAIVSLLDWSGATWVARAIILNALPMFLLIRWAKKSGKEYQEEMEKKLKKLSKNRRGGSKKIAETVDRIISKRLNKKIKNKAIKYLVAGIIPILSIFTLWCVFVISFHKERNRMVREINKGIDEMHKLQNRM